MASEDLEYSACGFHFCPFNILHNSIYCSKKKKKFSFYVPWKRKGLTGWNNLRVSKWWQNINIWGNCPYKNPSYNKLLWKNLLCSFGSSENQLWVHEGFLHLAENVRRGVVPTIPQGSTASHLSITNPHVHADRHKHSVTDHDSSKFAGQV